MNEEASDDGISVMTDGKLIVLKCEPKRTRSGHRMGDQAIPLNMGGTFGNLENTLNAQGDDEKTPAPSKKNQFGSVIPPEGNGKPLE